jgi:two-component system chemotaxis response regulator CheB
VAYRFVGIGASAGGLHALCALVRDLPAELPLPVAIVQHRSKESALLAELLQDCTLLQVREVEDKEPIVPGVVYLAPADYHLLVEPEYFSLSTDEPVRWSRPSIDVMFETAADAFGSATVGVVLTGANSDGARGLRRIAAAGGYAIVQDTRTSEATAMPAAALRAAPGATVLPLDAMAEKLTELGGAADA